MKTQGRSESLVGLAMVAHVCCLLDVQVHQLEVVPPWLLTDGDKTPHKQSDSESNQRSMMQQGGNMAASSLSIHCPIPGHKLRSERHENDVEHLSEGRLSGDTFVWHVLQDLNDTLQWLHTRK